MERLTKEKQIGPFAALKDEAESAPGAFNTYDCFYAHAIAVTRLKRYEDTRLTPEEIVALQASFQELKKEAAPLIQAKIEERLLVLPCKPGTEIFGHCHIRDAQPISHSFFYPPYVPTLGVNAWLTREEAEAALKKREA